MRGGRRVTAVLEPVDLLPPVRRAGRRRPDRLVAALVVVIVALVVVIVAFAAVIGTQAVSMRESVARERVALAHSRYVEQTVRRTIDDVRGATASANTTSRATDTLEHTRERERAQAHAALLAIERGLASTSQSLVSTKFAQVQIAQYAAQRDACIAGVRSATSALQRNDPGGAVVALRAAASPCAAALAAATGARFPYDFPDPSVLSVGSGFYAYSTNSGAGNIQVLFSRDLLHWSIVGDGLAALPAWAGRGATWAPAVVALGTRFVAYYTVREIASGRQCISAAVATSPRGPFVDASKAPFVCQPGGSIDPSPFVDAGGTPWLLWKSEIDQSAPTMIWSQPLSADGTKLVGAPNAILSPGQSWERGVVEGPSMITVAGHDFLFYSGGYWTTAGYAEGVVACDGPAGPCRHILPGPALVSQGRLAGPGGGAAFTTPSGAVWLAFHAFTQPNLGYPNSRTLHFATVKVVDGIPLVTPQ